MMMLSLLPRFKMILKYSDIDVADVCWTVLFRDELSPRTIVT